MNQEQRQLATARDLTRHWESSRMDLPSRDQWFKFFGGENSEFKSAEPGRHSGVLVSNPGPAGDQ
jgi:hypothetical protein